MVKNLFKSNKSNLLLLHRIYFFILSSKFVIKHFNHIIKSHLINILTRNDQGVFRYLHGYDWQHIGNKTFWYKNSVEKIY